MPKLWTASRRVVSLSIAITAMCQGQALCAAEADVRRFTVKDSVEMSYFGTINASMPDLVPDDAVISPDGRWILKITHRGVVDTGLTEATLWAFDVAATLKSVRDPRVEPPIPIRLLTLSAAANGLNGNFLDTGNVIFDPRWMNDGKTITFLGRDGGENKRLFKFDMDARTLHALTPADQDVAVYDAAASSIAYLVVSRPKEEQLWWSAGSGIDDSAVGEDSNGLMSLLYPNFMGEAFNNPVRLELWRIAQGEPARVVDAATEMPVSVISDYTALVASLSPDGTSIVTLGYPDASRTTRAGETPEVPLQYQLIDLRTGARRALSEVPAARFRYGRTGRYMAAWRSDSVAVTETMLSKSSAAEDSKQERCVIAIVPLDRGTATCAAWSTPDVDGLVTSIEWSSPQNLHVRLKRFRTDVFSDRSLQYTRGAWRTRAAKPSHPLSLTVREGLNRPPALFAIDTASTKEREVFDPNPQLESIDLGEVRIFEWRDSQGRENRGGLALPPGFTPGRRYPLVVQTHGFDPNRFFKVGYGETANAGRALTARDVIVLQVKEQTSPKASWENAAKNGLDVYLTAVDELIKRGMVDGARVGITGYSYTGWTVATSLTNAPDRFAAAVIANSDPVTLTGYYSYVDTPLAQVVPEVYVGARPYGPGLQTWIERVPSFATDKIRAAVLFSAADPWHLIGTWDMYAAMRDQRKPVELQYFRTGQHNIIKAGQRYQHQQKIVDWFDFWLNQREDATAAKVEQYARWRKLRAGSEGATPNG